MPTSISDESNLVILDYEDLLHDPKTSFEFLEPLLSKAFGSKHNTTNSSNNETISSSNHNNNNSQSQSPLGLIAIRNVPNFTNIKQAFLPLAHNLVNLPSSYLNNNLTDETSMYNAGYSYGKEMLSEGKPDLYKASYYFNPVTDEPGTKTDREKYPASYPCNKWPNSSCTNDDDGSKNDHGTKANSNTEDEQYCIPNFEPLAKEMGCLMKHVVILLSKHIDEYIQRNCSFNYPKNLLSTEMTNTEKVKARLLYYFPIDKCDKDDDNDDDNKKKEELNVDSWIGWHNDSGFLTALAGEIYVDHDTGAQIIDSEEESTRGEGLIDPNAGLYVMDRTGTTQKVQIPQDCMAVQIGECLQIVSGGAVVATPHCVRGVDPNFISSSSSSSEMKQRKIARISLPCFIDTEPSFPLKMPRGCRREDVLQSAVQGCAKVPPLGDRWSNDGIDFGTFLQQTFSMYYSWSSSTGDK